MACTSLHVLVCFAVAFTPVQSWLQNYGWIEMAFSFCAITPFNYNLMRWCLNSHLGSVYNLGLSWSLINSDTDNIAVFKKRIDFAYDGKCFSSPFLFFSDLWQFFVLWISFDCLLCLWGYMVHASVGVYVMSCFSSSRLQVTFLSCRVILDRGFTPWNDALEKVDLSSGQSYSGRIGEYITYIREKKM